MFSNQIILFVSIFTVLPILIMLNARAPTLGNVCAVFWSCGICGSMIVAYIMGMVWRFGEAGRFATSDEANTGEKSDFYQTQSGKFLTIFYFITWIILGIKILLAIILAIINKCCSK